MWSSCWTYGLNLSSVPGDGDGQSRWCLSQVKGAVDDDVAEGKTLPCFTTVTSAQYHNKYKNPSHYCSTVISSIRRIFKACQIFLLVILVYFVLFYSGIDVM